MQKEYILKGLSCAHCANKIEYAVQSLDGVAAATVNFMNTTLKVQTTEDYRGDLMTSVEKSVHKFEPDIVIIDKSLPKEKGNQSGNVHGGESDKKRIIRLISGTIIFGGGILLSKLFQLDTSVELGIFILGYLLLGGEVVLKALKSITQGQVFDENFLMSVATLGAFAIGDFQEAVAVMLFYQVGEYFQDSAVRKSKKSIADLMDIWPDSATVKKGNEFVIVAPENVAVGDIILVKPGEKIPLDGRVIDGESMVDTKALTGESVPRILKIGDKAISGCINQNGVLTILVVKTFGESTVAKIIDLVENASSKKSPTENFITTFSRYYTPVVVGLATLLAVIPPIFMGAAWAEWINRGLIFLVISCPCALVISIPLSFFGGIGGASKKGVLVKGSNYLEALNNLDIVVFDKTGTLTKGVFQVMAIHTANGFTENELLAYAAKAGVFSNHPIALSILKAYDKSIDKEQLSEYSEISGHGTRVTVNGKVVFAGNEKLMKLSNISFIENTDIGTKVYVAIDNQFAGALLISDEIKKDSRETIAGLKARGVRKIIMLTGDNTRIGEAIAKELGIDEVYTDLLPDQKVEKLEMLDLQKRAKGKMAFVGDGINDAPVLARADVGIAMGGLGSDAAIEAADVVLMTDEPSKLLEAIDIAKATKGIVWQNIIFALSVKGVFLSLGAVGIATMWEAVFADVGVAVIAILNAMRILKMK